MFVSHHRTFPLEWSQGGRAPIDSLACKLDAGLTATVAVAKRPHLILRAYADSKLMLALRIPRP
eukprot:2086090-Amphidinium_carterae.1